uniref:Uncharacterized protein n=1 Tax=Panagrolaimus davidi TaxID=227884 RepID=A0A914PNZ0_9BILA
MQIYLIFINCRDKTVFSTLLPRIYRCEAKFISLYGQSISFDELKFLIKHGGVVSLDLGRSEIKDEKGDSVCLDQIIQFLPYIAMLDIDYILGEPFDADEFIKFCKTNGDDVRFGIGLRFAPTFDRGFIEKFKETMEDYEESFESANVYIIQYD